VLRHREQQAEQTQVPRSSHGCQGVCSARIPHEEQASATAALKGAEQELMEASKDEQLAAALKKHADELQLTSSARLTAARANVKMLDVVFKEAGGPSDEPLAPCRAHVRLLVNT
jgi:hypothetical protein